jgi:hypothetical protein
MCAKSSIQCNIIAEFPYFLNKIEAHLNSRLGALLRDDWQGCSAAHPAPALRSPDMFVRNRQNTAG